MKCLKLYRCSEILKYIVSSEFHTHKKSIKEELHYFKDIKNKESENQKN